MAEIAARYAGRTDPVARRQIAKLVVAKPDGRRLRRDTPPRWGHVPLVELFEQAGNRVHGRSGGRAECGHEPVHGSKGGRCVTIDPTRGLWYCRSCRTGGDAVRLVCQAHGLSYGAAVRWLADRYGPPAASGRLPVLEA